MKPTTFKIRAWDLPTRVFHWGAVALVLAAYVTWQLNWMDWHVRAGEMLLALVLFRILWGFWGSQTARFRHFIATPRAALHHLSRLLQREPDRQIGHNPAGGWMVLGLLALLLAETLTGVYVNNDVADAGPFTPLVPAAFANAVTAAHRLLWEALLAAVSLHVVAILTYALAKRQNLLGPMITGRKTLSMAVPEPRRVSLLRALGLIGCSALAAAALARWG